MEDATTAILDFRDNLSQELATLSPEFNSYFGVSSYFDPPVTSYMQHISVKKHAVVCANTGCLLQVFDGHSGAAAANFASIHLHTYFAGNLQAEQLQAEAVQEAMVRCSVCVLYHSF